LPLAEFTGVIGSLRGARFGRDSACEPCRPSAPWMNIAILRFPCVFHQLVRLDSSSIGTQVLHTNNWFAIASALFDELTLGQNAIESPSARISSWKPGHQFAFVGLASLARESSDHMFRGMVTSIQTDEAGMRRLDIPSRRPHEHRPEYCNTSSTSGSGEAGAVLDLTGSPRII